MKRFFAIFYKLTVVAVLAAPIIILACLVRRDLVLDGQVEFVYDFSSPAAAITELFPANRLSDVISFKNSREFWQQIKQEPVYFEVRLPQKFATAEVEITFQNSKEKLLQVGLAQAGAGDWNYLFKPLDHPLLNQLDWFKLADERGTLWQRQKKYLNMDLFLANLDALNGLSAFNFPVAKTFKLPNYQPDGQRRVYEKAIRGNHSFYTYLKNEDLDFVFTIQDINRSEGPDPLVIKVFNATGQEVYRVEVEDDGTLNNFDGISGKREVVLAQSDLPEGVYRIELNADDDIFFRRITTRQRYLTFINRLYLVDNPEYADGFVDLTYQPTVVYSTIPRLGLETSHLSGLQTIGLGNKQSVIIKETHLNYYATPTDLPTNIYIPANDLKIFGRGLMALSAESYFNPELYDMSDVALTPETDYLISDYHLPENKAGWKTGTVKFNLNNASVVNRKLRFMISSPELNQSDDLVAIKEIKVILTKQPLTYSEIVEKAIKYFKERF